MFGRLFKCDSCGHSMRAGRTLFLETEFLKGVRFFDTGDQKGLWIREGDNEYCGECCDKKHPELTQIKDLKFKNVGCAMF